MFGPASTVWRVGRERVLLVGGPAALLMQLAHPLIAAAVARHSEFRHDPMRRLRGTLQAVLAITFGDRSQAAEAAAAVSAVHARVRGATPLRVGSYPAGTPYEAGDPELALWVHATLVASALATYARFVRQPKAGEREAYWQESKRFAKLFGVTGDLLPDGISDFDAYLDGMLTGPRLAVGTDATGLSRQVVHPALPAPLGAAAAVAGPVLTAGLLPERLRRDYGLAWGFSRRAAFRSAAATVRGTLPAWTRSMRFWPHYTRALHRLGSA